MTNQIQPSYISEEQPERFYCRKCGNAWWQGGKVRVYDAFSDCQHEVERRLPENTQKRRTVEIYLGEVRR